MASIVKQNNKYRVSIFRNGKRITKYGFKTKTEAKLWANEKENQILNQKDVILHRRQVTFLDFFTSWFETFKKEELELATQRRYMHTRSIIKNNFDNELLINITRKEFQEFLNLYGKTHSKATLTKFRSHIRSMVKHAIREDYLTKDFTEETSLPSKVKPKKESEKYLEEDEIEKLLSNLDFSVSSDLMIFTSLVTGLRYSEVAGLTFNDLKEDYIDVNKNFNEISKSFKDVKSEKSNREVTLSKDLINKIKTYSKSSSNQDFIFKGTKQYPPTSNAVNNRLSKIEEKLSINPITFHGLRHSHASYLISNGLDVAFVSKRLGHSNISITLDTYTHLFKNKFKNEQEKTNNILEKLIKF